jgi:mannose-6-phosphate isomerase-like protein (cupin superfamily)
MKIVNDSEVGNEKTISCGKLKQHFIDKDIEIDVNRIEECKGTKPHFHKKMTEIYLIVSGNGEMKIKDRKTGKIESKKVQQLSSILIPPNHIHQLTNTGKEFLVHYVICKPPWREDDEVFEDF